jgi:DNA-binding transcriptional ArsR family regulator
VAVRSRFTRIPKVHDLILAGVPTEVIPTYCALADYSNNKTGLCWPRMETLARRLSRSPRTVQRHLHLLKEKGLVEFVERKRDWPGWLGASVSGVVHIAAAAARMGAAAAASTTSKGSKGHRKNRATTGHGGPVAPNKGLTKRHKGTPPPPKRAYNEGYWWSFDENPPPGRQEEHDREANTKREEEAKRRQRGFEWLFE